MIFFLEGYVKKEAWDEFYDVSNGSLSYFTVLHTTTILGQQIVHDEDVHYFDTRR